MNGVKVLVVEDETIVAMHLTARLGKLGYECVGVAATGERAIENAAERRPDLVLMDIMLQGPMDGIHAAHEIRKRFDIPIIFLTAYSDAETLKRAKASEPFGYILKPFEERALQSTIEIGLNRHRSEKKLKRLERWLATTLNSLGDGVIAADTQGRVTYMNAVAQTLTGWSCDDAQGKVFADVFHVASESTRVSVNDPAARALQEGSVVAGQEGVLIARNGMETPIDTTAAPTRNDNGEISGVVIVFRDISLRKQAEEAKRKAEEQLHQSQKMEVIGRLAGGIAHDFNNVMTVVLGQCNMLLSGLSDNDPQRRRVQAVLNAGERAADLTQQLLGFSRKQIRHPMQCNLSSFIAEMQPLLRSLVGEDIELAIECVSPMTPVYADLVQLQQIVLNLGVNARDAMSSGGKLTYTIEEVQLPQNSADESMPPGAYVLLRVTDTGCGMDEETRSHIFEPFYKRKGAGRDAGLGLATVYGIVEQSGGRIEAHSEPGNGSEFRIYLPRTELAAATACLPATAVIVPGGKETILLVEDDDGVRMLIQEMLSSTGYSVLTAGNGAEALKVLDGESRRVDLLLTDIVMPIMNGVDLACEVQKRYPQMKTLFMSGYTQDLLKNKDGILLKNVNFIEKPLNLNRILQMIRETMKA